MLIEHNMQTLDLINATTDVLVLSKVIRAAVVVQTGAKQCFFLYRHIESLAQP